MKKIKVWWSSGDLLLASLLISCAWGKLSWVWFWIGIIVEMLSYFSFHISEEEKG